MTTCAKCPETIPTNKWSHIKAHDAGWFFTKDGKAFCPKDVPDWVADWRARRETGNNPDSGMASA